MILPSLCFTVGVVFWGSFASLYTKMFNFGHIRLENSQFTESPICLFVCLFVFLDFIWLAQLFRVSRLLFYEQLPPSVAVQLLQSHSWLLGCLSSIPGLLCGCVTFLIIDLMVFSMFRVWDILPCIKWPVMCMFIRIRGWFVLWRTQLASWGLAILRGQLWLPREINLCKEEVDGETWPQEEHDRVPAEFRD